VSEEHGILGYDIVEVGESRTFQRSASLDIRLTEGQETNPSSRQRGCYIRTITARAQLKKKISGRESQGA
jgi:hypothetical protein